MTAKNLLMLKISSHPSNIACLESFLHDVSKRFQLREDLFANMLISLTEAVNNAIIHGNQCDDKKFVHVYLEHNNDRISFRVCDEGKGFNPENLPDPTAEENLCKEGGRGVFLIKQLCDQVDFDNNGSTVKLNFFTR